VVRHMIQPKRVLADDIRPRQDVDLTRAADSSHVGGIRPAKIRQMNLP
jgi:hypothetical protein